MEFGLTEIDILKINSVFNKNENIDIVIIYGSRAKGNYKVASDIDLTLIGNDLKSSIIGQVNSQIDDLLLPYTFDISIFHQISNTDLIEHIERVGKIFYKKNK
jgi:predicted nucleotidyltransferase